MRTVLDTGRECGQHGQDLGFLFRAFDTVVKQVVTIGLCRWLVGAAAVWCDHGCEPGILAGKPDEDLPVVDNTVDLDDLPPRELLTGGEVVE